MDRGKLLNSALATQQAIDDVLFENYRSMHSFDADALIEHPGQQVIAIAPSLSTYVNAIDFFTDEQIDAILKSAVERSIALLTWHKVPVKCWKCYSYFDECNASGHLDLCVDCWHEINTRESPVYRTRTNYNGKINEDGTYQLMSYHYNMIRFK